MILTLAGVHESGHLGLCVAVPDCHLVLTMFAGSWRMVFLIRMDGWCLAGGVCAANFPEGASGIGWGTCTRIPVCTCVPVAVFAPRPPPSPVSFHCSWHPALSCWVPRWLWQGLHVWCGVLSSERGLVRM